MNSGKWVVLYENGDKQVTLNVRRNGDSIEYYYDGEMLSGDRFRIGYSNSMMEYVTMNYKRTEQITGLVTMLPDYIQI